LIEETGECGEQELNHRDGQAEKFYRDLKQRGIRARVGMEATGYSRWFERLLAELGFEVWIGDPAEIKTKRVKKQKTDREDAQLLLRLMRENNFPRIWVPSPENRDLRQLLWHRHRMVQMRTRIMNQLQALAMNEGYRWKKKLFSEQGRAQLEKLALAASRRRQELLELLDRLNPTIEELTAAVEQEARKRPEVLRLMTHPGVGPLTALAFVLIIGTWERFPCGKQVGNYVGMIPSEDSSAGKQRLGHISKQGSSLLRFLLVEAAQCGSTNQSGLATSVHAPGDASAQEHCQGSDGTTHGDSPVLDVAEWWRVFAVVRVRFVRGTARYRTWRELDAVSMNGHPLPEKGVCRSNHGRSIGRTEPTERLRTSRGRRSRGQERTRKTTRSSERGSALKKDLTGPTLLEMSGYANFLGVGGTVSPHT
jgi:transposase